MRDDCTDSAAAPTAARCPRPDQRLAQRRWRRRLLSSFGGATWRSSSAAGKPVKPAPPGLADLHGCGAGTRPASASPARAVESTGRNCRRSSMPAAAAATPSPWPAACERPGPSPSADMAVPPRSGRRSWCGHRTAFPRHGVGVRSTASAEAALVPFAQNNGRRPSTREPGRRATALTREAAPTGAALRLFTLRLPRPAFRLLLLESRQCRRPRRRTMATVGRR